MRRLFSIIFFLTLFVFSSLFSQEVEEIEWIPAEPVEGDDVIVALHGIFRDGSFRNQDIQGRIEDNNLILTFTSLSEGIGNMALTPFTLRHNWGELEAGEYVLFVNQFVGFVNENGDIEFENGGFYMSRIVVAEGDPDEFIINLEEGWDMISCPVAPVDNDIRIVFAEITEQGSLEMVKDGRGRFYYPEQDFNNIPVWVANQGYLVKVNENTDLTISGELLPEDDRIQLVESWNMVAYLPEASISAPEAFENIEDELILAKDGDGRFYSPEHNFSNMAELQRGRGYLVKVREAVELIWNQP